MESHSCGAQAIPCTSPALQQLLTECVEEGVLSPRGHLTAAIRGISSDEEPFLWVLQESQGVCPGALPVPKQTWGAHRAFLLSLCQTPPPFSFAHGNQG